MVHLSVPLSDFFFFFFFFLLVHTFHGLQKCNILDGVKAGWFNLAAFLLKPHFLTKGKKRRRGGRVGGTNAVSKLLKFALFSITGTCVSWCPSFFRATAVFVQSWLTASASDQSWKDESSWPFLNNGYIREREGGGGTVRSCTCDLSAEREQGTAGDMEKGEGERHQKTRADSILE